MSDPDIVDDAHDVEPGCFRIERVMLRLAWYHLADLSARRRDTRATSPRRTALPFRYATIRSLGTLSTAVRGEHGELRCGRTSSGR